MTKLKKWSLLACVMLAAALCFVGFFQCLSGVKTRAEETPQGFRPIESASNLGQNSAFSIGFETYGGLTASNQLEGFYQILPTGTTEKAGFTDKILFKLLGQDEYVDLNYLMTHNLVDNSGKEQTVKYFDNVEIFKGSLCFNSYGNHLIPGVIEAIRFEEGFTLYNAEGAVFGEPFTNAYEFTRELDVGTLWVNTAKVIEGENAVEVLSPLTKTEDLMPYTDIDLSGLVFGIHYDNDTVEPYYPTKADIVSPANGQFTEGGEQNIEFSIKGKTMSVPVSVANLIIQSIEWESGAAPQNVTFDLGGSVVLEGVNIVAEFNVGESQTIPVTSDMLSVSDNLTLGEKQVTLTYRGKTLTFTATCEDRHPDDYFEPIEGKAMNGYNAFSVPIRGFGAYAKDAETDPFKVDLHSIDLSQYCNADTHILLKIKGEDGYKTVGQLKEEKVLAQVSTWDYDISFYHSSDHASLYAQIEGVKFLAGFRMVTFTQDSFVQGNVNVGQYTAIEHGILRKDYEFTKVTVDGEDFLYAIKELSDTNPVTYSGENTVKANKGREVSLGDLEFTITYADNSTETFKPTFNDIVDPAYGIFTEGGLQDMTVMVKGLRMREGVEVTIPDIDVTVKIAETLELSKTPEKVDYKLGDKIDVTGITVHVTYKDGSEEVLPLTENLMVYDAYTAENDKTVTVKIDEATAEFKVNYTDPHPENKIAPSSASWVISGESWKYYPDEIPCVSMVGNGMPNLAAYAWVDLVNNTDTHLSFKLKGVDSLDEDRFYTAGELKQIMGKDGKPLFLRLNTFGNTLLFIFNEEITPGNVYQVKIHRGFFMVKGPGNSNVWDNTVGSPAENEEQTNSEEFNTSDTLKKAILTQCKPELNAIVKEDIIIENNQNKTWMRAFDESNPYEILAWPTKLDYKVGDSVSLAGMKIRLNYLDGGTEVLEPNDNYVNRPLGGKLKEAGEQTVTVVVNGRAIEFKVNVTGGSGGEDGEIDWGGDDGNGGETSGCSGSMSANVAICFAVGLSVLAVALAIVRKRQR